MVHFRMVPFQVTFITFRLGQYVFVLRKALYLDNTQGKNDWKTSNDLAYYEVEVGPYNRSKWSYNPFKWPYTWVTGLITLHKITPFITD